MKPIGGYFELALGKGEYQYHDTPYVMKSGRSALHYILMFSKAKLVYVPYYTCDALLESFEAAKVPYRFYEINERLEPVADIDLKEGAYFLYVNYLDLKRETVDRLSEKYKDKLIVDCSQAFFMKGNGISWFFNSCRKFFGVPDGSYLYAPAGVKMDVIEKRNEKYIIDHLLKRFNGHPGEGYDSFVENERMVGADIAAMSKLSEYLLSRIDHKNVAEIRRINYIFIHNRLARFNMYDAALGNDNVPMCYPLLLKASIDKRILFREQIFVPTFWEDTLERVSIGFEMEKDITDRLLPLPIDHRYSIEDMERICTSLTNILS